MLSLLEYNNLEKSCKDFTLLYVESNDIVREETADLLNEFFSKVIVARNGKEAIKIFRNNKKINLLITDINISDKKNGIKVISKMKDIREDFYSIVLSANEEFFFKQESLAVGVNKYLVKPFNINIFNKVILGLSKDRYITNLSPREKFNHYISLGNFNFLCLFDIDNFSIINRTYSKEFADKVLIKVYEILDKEVRKNDLGRVFKINGDKYGVLINAKQEEVKKFIERILNIFKKNTIIEDKEVDINFHIGCSINTKNENILNNAEYSLKEAKKNSINSFQFYNVNDNSLKKDKEKLKWINATKKLIETRNIKPHYQPIMDIDTGKIYKYEVLARGVVNGEIIEPCKFIPIAEKLGITKEITKIIIDKSFEYFSNKDLEFSINISGQDLMDNYDLENYIMKKVKEFNLNPNKIILEILENITISEDSKVIIDKINKFKSLGFQIAIDDFGADNSNFARLLDIDCNILKIDMLFVRKVDIDPKYELIVKGIVNLAKAMNIKTVAEYVESNSILTKIRECGVDYAQGYYIGKPNLEII